MILNYSEIKALAIGNPLIKERVELSNRLSRARARSRQRQEELHTYLKTLSELPAKCDVLRGQIEAVAAISAVNNYDSGWINFVDDTCTFTPRMINGKDPLCMWLGFKKTSNGLGNWTEVSDMMPVIITEEE